ncbi:MAG: hypothetical protein ACTSRR_09820 [Candidatus Heimdallarchaeaceae archaeon]
MSEINLLKVHKKNFELSDEEFKEFLDQINRTLERKDWQVRKKCFLIDIQKVYTAAFHYLTHARKLILAYRLERSLKDFDFSKNHFIVDFIETKRTKLLQRLEFIWREKYFDEFKEKIQYFIDVLKLSKESYITHREQRFLLLAEYDYIRALKYSSCFFVTFEDFLKKQLEQLHEQEVSAN